ncbi:MAG: 50S ribosomal protein L15 [Candidatus Gracilibacteria bacterium]
MLNHSTLRPKTSSRTSNKRLGRGLGSGKGVFGGRGCKGQKARTGKKLHPLFEGGQTPLHMRLPKLRGGTSSRNTSFNVIHLSDLEKIALGGTTNITLETLIKGGYVRGKNPLVKLLSGGKITQAVTLSLHAASATALAAVEKAGGSITILS